MLRAPYYEEKATFGCELKSGFKTVWIALRYVFMFLIVVLPVAIVTVGGIFFAKYLRRRRISKALSKSSKLNFVGSRTKSTYEENETVNSTCDNSVSEGENEDEDKSKTE